MDYINNHHWRYFKLIIVIIIKLEAYKGLYDLNKLNQNAVWKSCIVQLSNILRVLALCYCLANKLFGFYNKAKYYLNYPQSRFFVYELIIDSYITPFNCFLNNAIYKVSRLDCT